MQSESERSSTIFPYFSKYWLTGALSLATSISMKLEKASSQLEALGNPVRLQIYRLLVRAGVEGLPVGAIQDKLGVPASTLSHHMRKLVDTELVTQERQATTLICRAHYPAMTSLIGYLSDECCADGSCPPRSAAKAKTQETARRKC
jgi:DNA-binding transcriptional ArsR family regulator